MPSFDLATFPPADTLRLVARHIDALCAAAPMGMNGLAMVSNSTPSPITTHAQALQQQQQLQRASGASAIDVNSNGGAHPAHCSPFHASAIPSIDLATYLARVLKYCPCASECFIALVIYVERACNSGMVQLDRFSAHRLCITGVVVASKFFSDVFFTNSRYAKVGGLPTKELNQLELIFLKLCNFQLSIPVEELQIMGDRLLNYRRPPTAPAPPPLVLPISMAASEPPTPTSPYDIAAVAWRHCPESPMTSTPGSIMGQASPFARTPTEYFAQHTGPLQARPRHFRTYSYHPQMSHQSFVTGNGVGIHHQQPPHSFHAVHGNGHQHSHSLSHASSFSHPPSQVTALAHLQHLQQPASQANSPMRRTSGDSGYFALTPDRATTPASSTSSSSSSIYTAGTLSKSKSGAPISHRHSYAHPGNQVYPNVYHQPFMAEHMAARLQQQQLQQQQQMCMQQQQQQQQQQQHSAMSTSTTTTTTTVTATNMASVPSANLQQALHRLNIANANNPATSSLSSLYRTSSLSTLAPMSRKSISIQQQQAISPLSPSSASPSSAMSSDHPMMMFNGSQLTAPTSVTISTTSASLSTPITAPPSATTPTDINSSRYLVESPNGCCAPTAAENQSERPGASGERAGISPLNTPTAHSGISDASSPISISPPSSVANHDHRRSSSGSSMSLHGHSPLGRMEITSQDDDDHVDNNNVNQHSRGNATPSMLHSSSPNSNRHLSSTANTTVEAAKLNGWNLLVQNATLSKDSRGLTNAISHTTMVTGTLTPNGNHFGMNPTPPVMTTTTMDGYYH